MKRVAVIGRGTAGSQAVAHYLKYMPGHEIQWYFDPDIPVQSVGEGSTPQLLQNLFNCLDFNHLNMAEIDGALKLGIYKSGWGKEKENYLHQFVPPIIAYHFSAVALQNYVYEKVKNKVRVFKQNKKWEDIDADYIMDCSGKPQTYDDFVRSPYIPVNAANVTNCYWDYPKFQYTLTIARPYGWVFGIPLQNRCSIGYLFNRNINTIAEVEDDVKNVFEEYDLVPSNEVQNINFENYFRKRNYTNRVCYNGNSSFFLEPLEATSIALTTQIQRGALDVWVGKRSIEEANIRYKRELTQIETMIMTHYYAGSNYDTKFWTFAQERGERCIESTMKHDNNLRRVIDNVLNSKSSQYCDPQINYGYWCSESFHQNVYGLGIEKKMEALMS